MASMCSGVGDFLKNEFSACYVCNGFYGDNFGHPVCNSCHLFLFPDESIDSEDEGAHEKADSEDSGNEEPENFDDFYLQGDPPLPRVVVAPAGRMDRLADRVANLTVYREVDSTKVPPGLVESLPTEVLLVVFRYMDDMALYNSGRVCSRWRQILEAEMSQQEWLSFIKLRWPLFHPMYNVMCWKTAYTKLLESAPCKICVENIMLQNPSPIDENSWRHRRLLSELRTLTSDPPEGIQAIPLDKHCCQWQASLTGPAGSPYEGGIFYIYVQIPSSYPLRPPIARFLTKIFHPNVSRHGDIGLDSLYDNWSLALTISKVLISIQSLLTDPYCYVCMEPDIGVLYDNDRDEFLALARWFTWKYAMHDFLMPSDAKLPESQRIEELCEK